MSWNHRVVRSPGYLRITEVYYRNDKPMGYVEKLDVGGENLDELRWTLERMLEALDKPILDEDEIGGDGDGESE